ncbi:DUF2637 domain-containing protein [Streptomyces anulatus]
MTSRDRVQLTTAHRVLIAVVVLGAVAVAAIGFAGSYSAVSELAERKGFGAYSPWFPIGVDVSIVMLLALDVLLDWLGMTLALLRYAAWLLSGATVAFNALAAYPDPLGMAMHGTIPVAFLAAVEAARRAISQIAGLAQNRRMDGVRTSRWLLDPVSTALLWRRMKLFELRSYDTVIKLEQDRLIYRARLQTRFGRRWRRRAPVEALLPLRLARYGVPIGQTAPAGLAAAGIEPELLPGSSRPVPDAPYLGMPEQRTLPARTPAAPRSRPSAPQPRRVRKPRVRPATVRRAAPTPRRPRPPAPETVTSTPDRERGRRPRGGGPSGSNGVPVHERRAVHEKALSALRPADAVRYAVQTLQSDDVPTLNQWLKDHGKPVNSGQIWRIAQKAKS